MRVKKLGAVTILDRGGADTYQVVTQSGLVLLSNGAFDTFGDSLRLGPGTISREFVLLDVAGGQSIRQQLDALSTELSKGRRLLVVETRDGDERQTWVKGELSYTRDVGMGGYQTVTIEMTADYPYWLASEDEPTYLDDGTQLDGSWALTAGNVETEVVNGVPHDFVITNDGGAAVPRGWFQFSPRAGASVVNLRVDNLTNGYWFRYVGTLAAGDDLEVEFLPHAVRLNNSPAYANFHIGDSQESFMKLELGDNNIRITADSFVGDADLAWQWSRHYIA